MKKKIIELGELYTAIDCRLDLSNSEDTHNVLTNIRDVLHIILYDDNCTSDTIREITHLLKLIDPFYKEIGRNNKL